MMPRLDLTFKSNELWLICGEDLLILLGLCFVGVAKTFLMTFFFKTCIIVTVPTFWDFVYTWKNTWHYVIHNVNNKLQNLVSFY